MKYSILVTQIFKQFQRICDESFDKFCFLKHPKLFRMFRFPVEFKSFEAYVARLSANASRVVTFLIFQLLETATQANHENIEETKTKSIMFFA